MALSDWHNLASAEASAVAALTGLIFVALSINMSEILATPGLVGRAAEALVLLMQPLFTAFAVLTPHQSVRAVGIEVLIVAAVVATTTVRVLATSGRQAAGTRPRREFVTRCSLVAVAIVPAVIAAILLTSGSIDGMYWLVVAAVLSVAVGIVDAWILLVEILR